MELAQNKIIDATTTAPINKEVMNASDFHTGDIQSYWQSLQEQKDFGMMLASGPLRVILVTTHLALKDGQGILTRTGCTKLSSLPTRQ